ncbi:Anr2 protein [Saccharomycopsis crataegensis]|uniref:Anr2 protein n=1 Tax=Saccharomycopsis crataegensis TaxID=43959 RepID=A0AAV5QEI9_9ASCO|nr:Anr2 protein [Saccharomycopsis crataegensis]
MSLDPVLFITKFDVTKGYSSVYQSSSSIHDNLEYKSLPSGLHQSRFDIIRFLHSGYNGIAIFRQNGMNKDIDSNDRQTIKMYSLGLLYKDDEPKYLKRALEQFDAILSKFIDDETINENVFIEESKEMFQRYLKDSKSVSNGAPINHDISDDSFATTFNHAGPFVYDLWRYMLNNKRILIKNHFDRAGVLSNDNIINLNTALIRNLGQVIHHSSETFKSKEQIQTSEILYNISLQDIDTLEELSKSKSGYLACTSDDVIFTRMNLFDYMVEFDHLTKKPILKKNIYDRNSKTHSFKEIKFSNVDLNSFIKLQTGMDFELFRSMFDEWKLSADNSWASLLNSWIYGVPKSLSNVNNYGIIDENKSFEDIKKNVGSAASNATSESTTASSASKKGKLLNKELVLAHFDVILSHYCDTINDIIKNDDQDYESQRHGGEGSYDSEVDEFFGNDENDGLVSTKLDDNGLPIIELTLSDIHQLYLNPFAADDKQFVCEFVKNNFKRTVSITSFAGLSWQIFSCCG